MLAKWYGRKCKACKEREKQIRYTEKDDQGHSQQIKFTVIIWNNLNCNRKTGKSVAYPMIQQNQKKRYVRRMLKCHKMH